VLTAAGLPTVALLAWSPSLVWVFIGLPLIHCLHIGAVGPVYATIQERVAPAMRATTMSIIYVIQNLVGIGFGAVLLGAVSDAFAPRFGVDSLRYAMPVTAILFVLSAVSYAAASRAAALPQSPRPTN
jgi:predicted MFS family arabinose efflux permease